MTIATTTKRLRIRALQWRWRTGYRIRGTIGRYQRAWHYARGTLDAGDATMIIVECQDRAEWWPIETFDLNGVLEMAAEYWQPHPELENLARQACARVHSKWDGSGDSRSAAEDWAVDLIGGYAEDDGIKLVKVDPDE